MLDETRQSDLLALLAWWRDAGVDFALTGEPVDWTEGGVPGADFAWPDAGGAPGPDASTAASAPPPRPQRPPREWEGRAQPPAPSQPSPGPRPVLPATQQSRPSPQPPVPAPQPRMMPAPPDSSATMAAREAARGARTLEELEKVLRGFDGCPLKATAKNLCFYRGNPRGRLMVIGEAPGRDEDLEGRPFVGRAGQLLDRMLAAIALTEDDVHITNVVYWRPPGNRTPTPDEVQICQPFLERQIALVAPQMILTLGGPAAKAILGVTDGILRVRGKWGEVAAGEKAFRVMPSLHPAYLLRTPGAKKQAWRELLAVKLALEETPGGKRS